MAEQNLFIVTEDMPEWQKWLVAKEIAEFYINYGSGRIHLHKDLIIVADTDPIDIEKGPASAGSKLRGEMEKMINALINDFSIQVQNPGFFTGKGKYPPNYQAAISKCPIRIV